MKDIIETWRPVVGYENYEVSNFGRVRSLVSNKILKPGKGSHGYLTVNLCKEGSHRNFLIHRLVAEAFIPNPNKLPQVNHKDENKTNNFVWINPDGTVDFEKSNLEWCSVLYNNRYGTHVQRIAKAHSKPVAQYTLEGVLITAYSSSSEAERLTGVYNPNISLCCRGKRKTAGGYIWRYI